ncbi:hypothetical protein JM16_007153 [Phytophthora kernoviae]|uniref:Alternative oxidase n=1 Tax=Phytophthora kernoviae TaxID=325452 RepID=A0A8T0LR37_9STRA|nr:hypothetical protein JM16_007153 [Phytophthora kernoviae]
MAARLTLPNRVSSLTILKRVQAVVDDMGLRACEDTMVGDIFHKGISGGQKRRLSIAIELLSDPSILLLDEPTSGLDSASTFNVMKLVSRLAKEGRTIILYFGPRAKILDHFSTLGYNCPQYRNPAEFFIDLVNTDFEGHGDIKKLVDGYAVSGVAVRIQSAIPPSPLQQFVVLFHRNLLNNLRNPGIYWVRLTTYIMLSFMTGTMYLSTNTSLVANDTVLLLTYVNIYLVFFSIAVLPFFIEQRTIFLRERANSRLNVFSYVIANLLGALPGIFLIALSSTVLVGYLAGLNSYGVFLTIVFLSLIVAENLMHLISACIPQFIVGMALGAAIYGWFILCMGLFPFQVGLWQVGHSDFMHMMLLFFAAWVWLVLELADWKSCRPNANVRAHLGFAPHQLSGFMQARTDKAEFAVKVHGLPITPSKHIKWRVFTTAPRPAKHKLVWTVPTKVELPDIKVSAAPLPEIKDVTEEPASLKHFSQSNTKHALQPIGGTIFTNVNDVPVWKNPVPHPVYNLEEIQEIPQTHHKPKKIHEYVALLGVKALRGGFDLVSGYRGPGGAMTEKDWLNRCLFLETVAGVPGMVAGMARHLQSLRSLKRDFGWIHTLLEEAENERMHLLIFMNMKQPGWGFRMMVLAAQGVFFNAFFFTYLVSPKTCHRFVGYLEEEAVKTYTCLLEDIEHGHLDEWCIKTAPLIGRSYYNLPDDAKVYDMIKCIRADEANHRYVNHTFADLNQKRGVSPFVGQH